MPPKDKKPAPPAPSSIFSLAGLDPFEALVVVVVVLSFLGFILNRLLNADFSGLTFFGFSFSNLWIGVLNVGRIFKIISFIFSVTAFFAAVYFSQKTGAIFAEYKAKLFPAGEPEVADAPVVEHNQYKERWKTIMEHANSESEPYWRLAIIEADIILQELLDKLNLPGDSIGEKLKAVEKSDFLTLDYAWDAHRVRNAIAHEGSNYPLNQRQARQAISHYEAVFREFYLI
jgi:hypothetical protein